MLSRVSEDIMIKKRLKSPPAYGEEQNETMIDIIKN